MPRRVEGECRSSQWQRGCEARAVSGDNTDVMAVAMDSIAPKGDIRRE